MEPHTPRPVLFFDGVCNLCNSSVQFVIRHDKKKRFLFAQLQSPKGAEALSKANNAGAGSGSVILFHNDVYYTRSSAVLYTARLLGGIWQLAFIFIIIPPVIRDAAYNVIALNRYRWFGHSDACMVPSAELKERFLD